jgi:hypothetical protein
MASMKTAAQIAEHEAATIKAFIVRDKQERLLSFAGSPKNRKKFTRELPHFRWFDKKYSTPVSWSPDPKLKLWERHVQGIENIVLLLKSKGAGETCWVISADLDIDGKLLALESALESVVGSGTGAILSCIPGKLAYFEGEDESLLLAR